MTLLRIDTSSDRAIYLQIVDGVRREVVRGTLAAGEPLPSVRQLAEELRLNPNTVQQAYRELEREGLALVRRGQGTFIRDDVEVMAQRGPLAERVARTALGEAMRAGLTGEELVESLKRLLTEPTVEGSA
jgi:GntR family transcriptional regulator